MAGGGRGTGITPMPKDGTGTRYTTDKAGNKWALRYENGIFKGMEYVEKTDPPLVQAWNSAGDIWEWIAENWKAGVIIVVALLILTR